MFGWFKKKEPELPSATKAMVEELFGPQARAMAITDCVKEYVDKVKAGTAEYPAHRRKNASVQIVWNDVRLEALHKMFGYGKAEFMMLSDFRRQNELFTTFVKQRPHLEFPQPRGETLIDTLQAIWQVYLYLDAVGSELADPATDRMTLKAKHQDIMTMFSTRAEEVQRCWAQHEAAIRSGQQLPGLPPAMIDVLWEDVTAKTKSIAISKMFGPMPEANMTFMLDLVAKEGTPEQVEELKIALERVRKAKEPEDISN